MYLTETDFTPITLNVKKSKKITIQMFSSTLKTPIINLDKVLIRNK